MTFQNDKTHQRSSSKRGTNVVYPKSNNIQFNAGEFSVQNQLNTTEGAVATVPDRYHLALIIVGVLGFAALLPFNLYCTAIGYYTFQLRDRVTGQPSSLALAYESTITVANAATGLIFSILNTYLTARISYQKRIYFAFIVMIVLYGFTAAIALVSTDEWQGGFFAVTLICLIIAAATGSVVSSAALGVASVLPSVYITSVLIGMGISGVFTSVASIIALAVSSSPVYEGFVYFIIATVASVIAIFLFAAFNRLEYVKHYIHNKQPHEETSRAASTKTEMLTPAQREKLSHIESNAVKQNRFRELLHLLRLTWPYCLSMMSTFFVTLTVFPAIMARVVGAAGVGSKYFVVVYTFLVFNVLDVVGRYIFGLLRYPRLKSKWTPWVVNAVAFLRLAFIPLILLCNIQPRGSQSSVVFGDGWFIAFSALLALTNGYIKNLSSMYPPQIAPAELMETCGSLLITAMYAGILAGGVVSFFLVYILEHI